MPGDPCPHEEKFEEAQGDRAEGTILAEGEGVVLTPLGQGERATNPVAVDVVLRSGKATAEINGSPDVAEEKEVGEVDHLDQPLEGGAPPPENILLGEPQETLHHRNESVPTQELQETPGCLNRPRHLNISLGLTW